MMKRTQLYIHEHLHQAVNLLAARQEIPAARFLRTIITDGVKVQSRKSKAKSLEPLIELKIRGGPHDLSRNIKKYLYG